MGETTRTQRLALHLIYARLMLKKSRLAAARASEDHAVREVLEVGGFDEEDEAAREAEAQLDGCYVVESDLPATAATTQQVHDRYVSLTLVERDFRTLKTGLLQIRPVFLRKEGRTRGHALVSLLALKLARELDRRMAPLGLTVADAIDRLNGVRLVRLGEPGLGLWRLPGRHPVAQTEVLEALPKLPAPVLSLGKPNVRRLRNPRKGRSNQ